MEYADGSRSFHACVDTSLHLQSSSEHTTAASGLRSLVARPSGVPQRGWPMPATCSIRSLALLCLLAILVAACATTDLVKEGGERVAGYGDVFGRFIVIEDGKEANFGFMSDGLGVRIRPAKTDETQLVKVKGDGSFYWSLRPGDYVIQSLWFKGHTVRLWTSFTVPETGKAAYLGDVTMTLDHGRIRIGFADQYAVRQKHAEGKAEAIKGLLRPEQELGSRIEAIRPICSGYWGLSCERSPQGVVPLSPKGAQDGYPLISTLTPLFAWKPSPNEGVTYELAIYEDYLWPGYFDAPLAQRERGKLIFFTEGIREAKYQLETPLQPGRKYMWSVRLRNGDTVSTWSVRSYYYFWLVGYASGSGLWFGFETPAK